MSRTIRGLLALLALALPGAAIAREAPPTVRLEVASRNPAFDGREFGAAGAYEVIKGIAHLRIDPDNSENRRIVDLRLAPRGPDGLVAYDVDVVILRPRETAKARRVLLYDVLNRGMKLLAMFTGGSPMSRVDPIDPGDGALLSRGYTLVWSGWQGDVTTPGLMGARFPVAREMGRTITGRVQTETIFDNLTGDTMVLPHAAASLNKAGARLTVRQLSADVPREIAPANWRFLDDRHIALVRPADMDAGAIYRLEYEARDPIVMGLGFAATRDLIAWLRHAPAARGNPLADLASAPCERNARGQCANPQGGAYSTAIAFGGSQSARYLRDFVWQGFNRDLTGRRVFDGVMPMVPGARQTFTNFRWAEPGRFSRQHEDHDVPGFAFPFTYGMVADPVTGRRDGILQACARSATCPRVMHVDTSGEFWQAGASLVGTGGTNRDVPFPPNVRAYMIAGGSHAPGFPSQKCGHPINPLNYSPVVKALLPALVDWTLDRREPPESRWPSLDRGELVPLSALHGESAPRTRFAWPRVLNEPVPPEGKQGWPMFVPAVDADGNDRAGIRLPEVAVPAGTLLGWNMRKPGFGEGDLCFPEGSFLPFAPDAASQGSDPRRSMAERYKDDAARQADMGRVAGELVRDGFLQPADAAIMTGQADRR